MEELGAFLRPWYESLVSPKESQRASLERLLSDYARTEYGKERGAEEISTVEEYRRSFPPITYQGLDPYLQRVKEGEFSALLPEPPLLWAMTRGTTTGQSKFIPYTETDLEERTKCGPRALLNYVQRTRRYDILGGYVLNLNLPSVWGTMTVGGREISYGPSSGVYAKYNAERARLKLTPTQDEVDELGGKISKTDWERRFTLVYEKARYKDVTMVIGVVQTMIKFGGFLRRFGVYPKDLWDIDILLPTSAPGIQTKYKPALRALYGDVAIVEMYGATEGLFAQQLDEKPYVVPNYDTFFFEVETRRGVKEFPDLAPGEHGSLIVSTCLFPRYKIGDLVVSFSGNYYRCIGRERRGAYLRYLLDQAIDLEFRWPLSSRSD